MVTALDIVLIIFAYVYVFGIIYLASRWKRTGRIDGTGSRKLVHIGIGILVILAPLVFSSYLIPVGIGLSFIIFTYLTSPVSPVTRFRLSAFTNGHGLGTVYYSISLTLLLFGYFEDGWIIQVAFLPLVFGDAIANLAGLRYGDHPWPYSSKTLEGTGAGMLATLVVLVLVLSGYLWLGAFAGDLLDIVVLAALSSVVMGLVELGSPRGLDNIFIPLFCLLSALGAENILLV